MGTTDDPPVEPIKVTSVHPIPFFDKIWVQLNQSLELEDEDRHLFEQVFIDSLSTTKMITLDQSLKSLLLEIGPCKVDKTPMCPIFIKLCQSLSEKFDFDANILKVLFDIIEPYL